MGRPLLEGDTIFRLNNALILDVIPFADQTNLRPASRRGIKGEALPFLRVWQLNDNADLRAEMVALLPRMRRFAIGLAGNVTDADDLLQSAVEKALMKISQFERGTRLESWLFRIIQTTWIDSRRRAYRREVGMEAEVIEHLPSAAPPDESETRYSLKDVQKALAQLPDEQRSTALLVLVEGYSYEEAASMTGVPIGTVMSRISRARRSMAASLEGR